MKIAAAAEALREVRSGMALGLGTGKFCPRPLDLDLHVVLQRLVVAYVGPELRGERGEQRVLLLLADVVQLLLDGRHLLSCGNGARVLIAKRGIVER